MSKRADGIVDVGGARDLAAYELALQGFVTAISNPKGWAFFIALLRPFIDPGYRMMPQLGVLLSIILLIEFSSLLMYAAGGNALSRSLQRSSYIRLMNRGRYKLHIGCNSTLEAATLTK